MAEPMTGTLSSTKYPFSPKNMYSMDVWKRAKSQVRSTGSINYVRLGYWRIVASHSDSTTGKRRQRKKCARPKKKTRHYLQDHQSFCTIQDHTKLYQWIIRHLSPPRDCSVCWFIQAPTLAGSAVTLHLSPASASLKG